MGPISRVNARPTNPYLQWRERLEEKKAEKEPGFAGETRNAQVRRTRDEYVPGPDRAPESGKLPEKDEAARKADGKKPELYRGSTDKVDREIEKLKKRKEELEAKIRTEQDVRKIQSLKQELAQVERELGQKDNDGYRRRHMAVTKM